MQLSGIESCSVSHRHHPRSLQALVAEHNRNGATLRPKATMNLPQLDAFQHITFVASCCFQRISTHRINTAQHDSTSLTRCGMDSMHFRLRVNRPRFYGSLCVVKVVPPAFRRPPPLTMLASPQNRGLLRIHAGSVAAWRKHPYLPTTERHLVESRPIM